MASAEPAVAAAPNAGVKEAAAAGAGAGAEAGAKIMVPEDMSTLATNIAQVDALLAYKAEPKQELWFFGGMTTNKKVPPRTPLLVFRDAKVEKKNHPDFLWDFSGPTKKTKAFHNVGNVMVLKSLKDIIDSTKALASLLEGAALVNIFY